MQQPHAGFPDGELGNAFEIGAVDDRSVRVWVRNPGAAVATAHLGVAGRAPVSGSAALSAAHDWTGAITLALPEPAPGAAYVCRSGDGAAASRGDPDTVRREGTLAPSPGERTAFTFAFGSCHMPFALQPDGSVTVHAGAGIYPAAEALLQRERARFLLLAGDQIYADMLPPISVRATPGPGGSDRVDPAALLAAYRRVYRGFFQQSGFRRLRERLPVYCIWDDHDIFDDRGSRPHERPIERELFEAAQTAYCEYQHLRNPHGAHGNPPYDYHFTWGDTGFIVLDLRGARDYDAGRMLGSQQTDRLHAYLGSEEAAQMQTLCVVASVPLTGVSRWFALAFERLPGTRANAVRDRWTASAFIHSRDALLEALFQWQTAQPGRQVLVLSGDIHAAGVFTIRRRGAPGVIQQLISSAFTTPHGWRERAITDIAAQLPNLFEQRYQIERRLLAFANNIGTVRLTPLAAGGHRAVFTVHTWRTRAHALGVAGRFVFDPA